MMVVLQYVVPQKGDSGRMRQTFPKMPTAQMLEKPGKNSLREMKLSGMNDPLQKPQISSTPKK